MFGRQGIRLVATLLGVGSLAMGVTACTGEETPAPSPTTAAVTPTPTPTVASPQEVAEEAAAAGVIAYYAVRDLVLGDPTSDINRVYEVAQGAAADDLTSQAFDFRNQQWRLSGVSVPEVERVVVDLGDGTAPLTATASVCLDVGDTDVTGPDGASMVAADRLDKTSVELTLVSRDGASQGPWYVDSLSQQGAEC